MRGCALGRLGWGRVSLCLGADRVGLGWDPLKCTKRQQAVAMEVCFAICVGEMGARCIC